MLLNHVVNCQVQCYNVFMLLFHKKYMVYSCRHRFKLKAVLIIIH